MKCVIPCAGRGTRMGLGKPKALLEINGRSILEHIINRWADTVDGFVVIVSPENEVEIRDNGGNAECAIQAESRGLADAILQAEPYVNGKFIVNLGDCLFKGKFKPHRFDLGIGVWETNFLDEEILKNYQVEVEKGLIKRLIEKPDGFCGMGVYFLDTRVFGYIREAQVAPGGGDLTEILQTMIDAGEEIKPVWFEGEYINITYPEDLKKAERIIK